MTPLNKLIEQYETENPGKSAIVDIGHLITVFQDEFVQWQANQIETLASRPTCGEEQRLFLDEVEKEGEYVDDGRRFGKGIDIGKISAIYQFDTKADLQKVIKGN